MLVVVKVKDEKEDPTKGNVGCSPVSAADVKDRVEANDC